MLPDAETIIADKGIPRRSRRTRHHALHSTASQAPVARNILQDLYRQRHKVENMFARLKDWRRISMRYDRCAHTFFSAICIAATVIFCLGQ